MQEKLEKVYCPNIYTVGCSKKTVIVRICCPIQYPCMYSLLATDYIQMRIIIHAHDPNLFMYL